MQLRVPSNLGARVSIPDAVPSACRHITSVGMSFALKVYK